ncbi:hypothetical protein OAN307_c02410 [Octadecabacter antarcticus 307]|uniref:Uncharacterized protein n=1 Tax=Octadecabacter antarcticus 307 TaxID=391626 RepID=M9R8C5_9RHOB|nr:hypothetical protein OAN307_c02410 [Octadecabacter antarcticus 307]
MILRRGVAKKRAQSAVASLWSHSGQSSLSIRKGVLLAGIFEILFFEFFNRIGEFC